MVKNEILYQPAKKLHPHPDHLKQHHPKLLTSLSNTQAIKRIGLDLGFQQVAITDTKLDPHHARYHEWISANYHGEMGYMERNVEKRLNPAAMVPGTLSVICVRLDYQINEDSPPVDLLDHGSLAYISRYALGRDYHKLMRKRLQKFADKIIESIDDMNYRVFTDSAPVLEKALAEKAGLGWQGKHSNILNREHGSWFFLGEIFTDLPLEVDKPVENHCGRCRKCIDICPTQAIVAPYLVDARRCISYLTIEHHSAIPVEFRAAIGNRIYGCDDCQLVCPWNRFSGYTAEADFQPRHGLDRISLLDCYSWTEKQFLQNMEGSAIRRIGYHTWLRNIVIALGNADPHPHIVAILKQNYDSQSDLIREHLDWSIQQQESKL
ncbi:MAG: epoxyqueuosine reductase [Planctomycetota bacterium]